MTKRKLYKEDFFSGLPKNVKFKKVFENKEEHRKFKDKWCEEIKPEIDKLRKIRLESWADAANHWVD